MLQRGRGACSNEAFTGVCLAAQRLLRHWWKSRLSGHFRLLALARVSLALSCIEDGRLSF